jgi:putative flippase GtrA
VLKIVEFIKKYREVIMYLIFGVLTTIVNIASYLIFTKIFNLDYLISNVIAWVLSVLFAYITNKIYVFESKTVEKKLILFEIISFFSFRLISGLIDMICMYIFVSMIGFNDSIMKIITNVIVVLLNYIFSKLFIFNKKSKIGEDIER